MISVKTRIATAESVTRASQLSPPEYACGCAQADCPECSADDCAVDSDDAPDTDRSEQ